MVWFSLLLWFCLDNCHPSGRLGHLHPRESCNTLPETVLSCDRDLSIMVSAHRVHDPDPENGGEDCQPTRTAH